MKETGRGSSWSGRLSTRLPEKSNMHSLIEIWWIMKACILAVYLVLSVPAVSFASGNPDNRALDRVHHIDRQQVRHTSASGVTLRALVGPLKDSSIAQSKFISVILLNLLPGAESAWSYTTAAEETFIVKSGAGIFISARAREKIASGSYLVLEPRTVHAFKASALEPLEIYEISAPPWSKKDDTPVAGPADPR